MKIQPPRHEDTKKFYFFLNLVPWCLGGYFKLWGQANFGSRTLFSFALLFHAALNAKQQIHHILTVDFGGLE